MEDIGGEHADKTVTLKDFPSFDIGVKMASSHSCKHRDGQNKMISVLLDR